MTSIAIVDYGMGNYHSVERALRHAAPEADIRLCKRAQDIDAADRVVFPGQGAMSDCMRKLDQAGLRAAVVRAARNKPLLGVCVGEQMLFERSDEGNTTSLGIFKGEVKRFSGPLFAEQFGEQTDRASRLKVPHMGWNPVRQTRSHALWAGIVDSTPFYFVHSYYATLGPETKAQTDYIFPFSAAVQKDNFYATQFHPEKSGWVGEKILGNFLNIAP